MSKTNSRSFEGKTTHSIDSFQPMHDLISPTYMGEHYLFDFLHSFHTDTSKNV